MLLIVILLDLDHFPDNEIDGDGFLLMDQEQIKQLVPKIGPQAKLLQVHLSCTQKHTNNEKVY